MLVIADCILLYGGRDVVTNRFYSNEKDGKTAPALDEERAPPGTGEGRGNSCAVHDILLPFRRLPADIICCRAISAKERAQTLRQLLGVQRTQTEKVDVSGEGLHHLPVLRDLRYPLGLSPLSSSTARQ